MYQIILTGGTVGSYKHSNKALIKYIKNKRMILTI